MNKLDIGFIGAGNMAGAIMNGIVGAGKVPPGCIGVYDVDAEKRTIWSDRCFAVFEDIPSLVKNCSTVVLAVKPQVFPQVLPQVCQGISPKTVLVSIAAGITTASIKEAMGFDCKVIRVMPNTPLLLGAGASALSREQPVSDAEFDFVMDVFAAAGIAREVEPTQMNQIIPVNGSSPAFVYLMAKTVVDWAEKKGIDSESAMSLFCQTLTGSARMLMESGKSPQALIDMVCSPGGTTLASMEALRQHNYTGVMEEALDACVKRADELAR